MAYFIRENVLDLTNNNEKFTVSFQAQKVSLGTYIYQPTDNVVFTSKGLCLIAPHCKHPSEKTVLNIQKSEIVKIVCNFEQKTTLIIYVVQNCGKYIRGSLEMSLNGQCFNLRSKFFCEKRIMIEVDSNETIKCVIKSIFPPSILEEISFDEISRFFDQSSPPKEVSL